MARLKKRLSFLLWILAPLFILPFLGVWYERHKQATFLQGDDFYQLDSIAGHVHAPNAERYVPWPEHPDSAFTMRTNNMGSREDADTDPNAAVMHIMVVGDSHTDGVCNNSESFVNLAERDVNSMLGVDAPMPIEIINGGTGFYSFQQYAGFFRKYEALTSQWTIVVYLGNDFIEALMYDSTSTNVGPALQTSWYRLRKKWMNAGTGLANTQSVNQLLYFDLYPEKKAQAWPLQKSSLAA